MRYKYHGFTIVELLGAMIIISLALLSILGLLRVAITYTNKTKQETIAINLAREGIEGVYNRRNTNWLRQSGEKDKNRLNTTNEIGLTATWFQGSGTLYELTNEDTLYGPTLSFKNQGNLTGESILGIGILELGVGDFIGGQSPDVSGRFYRAIVGEGLYQKDTNTVGGVHITSCGNGDDTYPGIDIDGVMFHGECDDFHPKEYRFCSRVEYEKDLKGKVELCGAITNYQE